MLKNPRYNKTEIGVASLDTGTSWVGMKSVLRVTSLLADPTHGLVCLFLLSGTRLSRNFHFVNYSFCS